MQVDPIKPTFKAPGSKRLKLKYNVPLSNFALNSTCAATAREIYEGIHIMFAPTLEDTVASRKLTQSEYLESNSMSVSGPWRGYTYFDHDANATVQGGWDINLKVGRCRLNR